MNRIWFRVSRLAWGLMGWQRLRCLGVAIIAMCLAVVFAVADMSYSTTLQQTRASVESIYRGFRLQIVPDQAGITLTGAVAVQTDEVRVDSGSRSVDASRSRVGLDALSADSRVAEFGLLVSGRHSSSASEVSLSETAAARLAASVGDQVQIGAEVFEVVGIFVLPTRPQWAAIAGIAGPTVDEPTAWLVNDIPEYLGDSGYTANSADFETMLAAEVIDQGPLGFVRYLRPAFLVIAACLFAFLVMLFNSGVSMEHRGLVAAGMRERQAGAVVSVACALSAACGAFVGWIVVALTFLLAPRLSGRPWGMRWLDVPFQLRPATAIFVLVLVCVALLLPVLPARRPAGERALRRRPLPRATGWIALVLCCAGVAMVAYPRSREYAEINWWLALTGSAAVSLAIPVALAAATRRSRLRALAYVSRQRSKRALPAILILTAIAFAASIAATEYAHGAKIEEAWYRPFQPAGSLAVREVTNAAVLRQLADANPRNEMSTRFDSTGLLVVRPSIAGAVEVMSPPLDEEVILAGLDPELTIQNGSTWGSIGEPAEVWTIGLHPEEHSVLVDPSFIENGQVVIARLRDGEFTPLATVAAVPTSLLGGGGGFPDAVVESLARYGGEPNELRDIALLDFASLSDADQGQLEGLARSIAPAAFIDIDAGYQDGGFYAFSQLVGYGAALLVALMAVALGFQIISEELEFRLLIVRSGRTPARRWIAGAVAFLPVTGAITAASMAGLTFTHDTGLPEIAGFGYTPLAFVLVAVVVTVVLGVLHARDTVQ
jgi:hypothetical protein